MTTLIIDNSSKEAKKMLEYLKTQAYVRIVEKTPARGTKQVIDDAMKGKEPKYVDGLMQNSKELEHDTYPFKPESIKYQNFKFDLSKNLDCIVEFEDDNYIIKNEELDIIVWGATREEVEDAFNFSFYSLYINYYLEDNSKLSDEAIFLKSRLHTIIKLVTDEA
jgi:hypothetical protein